jgi:3D (Asp-Asp-Asp) domain-containing protein
MKNLVRGGAILSILSLCVVFIYAQAQTSSTLAIANDSQATIQNNISESTLINKYNDDDDDKKLVKKTVSVKASAAGASRGTFSASAYCFTGRMANGQGVRRGMIAADPRVLKMGSKVYINAGQWSGVYTVGDTGGAIKGKRIDLWVPGCSEARKFGRRSVQIFAAQ